MAERAGLSQTAVVRIWHAFGLQPQRLEKASNFPKTLNSLKKYGDIVGL